MCDGNFVQILEFSMKPIRVNPGVGKETWGLGDLNPNPSSPKLLCALDLSGPEFVIIKKRHVRH